MLYLDNTCKPQLVTAAYMILGNFSITLIVYWVGENFFREENNLKRKIVSYVCFVILLLFVSGCKAIGTKGIFGNNVLIDWADVLNINGIHFVAAHEQVITDDRIIDKEIGKIKFNISEGGVGADYKSKDGDATFLKIGTKVYSLKGYEKSEYVAAQNNGRWVLYRAMTQDKSSGEQPTGNGIIAESYNAVALVVEKLGSEQAIRIEDGDKIKTVVEGIKSGKITVEDVNYPQDNLYSFYFVIPDNNGIGQIVYKYYLKFQDINLDGYVRRFNDTFKVDGSVSKIIAEPFGASVSVYESKLGGKQQVYDIFAEGKFILRKVVKEVPQEKFALKILNQGEEIWQNGKKATDNLPGKYKAEIFMKDTKLQNKVLEVISSKQYKLPELVDMRYSTAEEGNSSVLYLCYDMKPDFHMDESTDSFVLVFKEQ